MGSRLKTKFSLESIQLVFLVIAQDWHHEQCEEAEHSTNLSVLF